MKKIGYSAGMKAVAMLMQEIFAVALVVCIILVSTFEIANKVQTLAKFRSRDISKVHHIY